MADDQRPSASTIPTAVGPARFTPEEFGLLIESGVAAKLGRIELRGGEIYRMNAQYSPHLRMKMALIFALKAAAEKSGLDLDVGTEGTVRFGSFLPLPDVFLYAPFSGKGPVPGENVRLIVEVADTTVADDLGPKRDLYAEAGLAEHWVVDMVAGAILQHAKPDNGAFQQSKVVARGAVATSLTLPAITLDTAKLPWDVG